MRVYCIALRIHIDYYNYYTYWASQLQPIYWNINELKAYIYQLCMCKVCGISTCTHCATVQYYVLAHLLKSQ